MRHRRVPASVKVRLVDAEATIIRLEPGDALFVRVDPDEFEGREMQQGLADAIAEQMHAAGHDPRRCLVVTAGSLELGILRQVGEGQGEEVEPDA